MDTFLEDLKKGMHLDHFLWCTLNTPSSSAKGFSPIPKRLPTRALEDSAKPVQVLALVTRARPEPAARRLDTDGTSSADSGWLAHTRLPYSPESVGRKAIKHLITRVGAPTPWSPAEALHLLGLHARLLGDGPQRHQRPAPEDLSIRTGERSGRWPRRLER